MYGKPLTPPIEPDAWLDALPPERRAIIGAIDARIRELAPGLRRYVDHGFLSYGRYTYHYSTGRAGEWMCIALASNKQFVSLYLSPVGTEPFASRLPKASLGRGCVRFKRLDDLPPDILDEMIVASAAYDGVDYRTR